MTTRIEICNRALARVAAVALQSESAPGAEQILRLYDDTVRLLIGLKRWRFATRTVLLNRQSAAPEGGFWAYQHQLKADRIGLPDALFDRKGDGGVPGGRAFTGYELMGDLVLTNAETIYVRERFLAPIAQWPALFRECVIEYLAGHVARTVNEDAAEAERRYRLVLGDPRVPGDLGLLGKASSFDQQSSPSRIIDIGGGALVNARYPGA